MSEIEVEISLTDITLNEADGEFLDVEKLMRSEPPYSDMWVIRTDMSVSGYMGMCNMELQMQNDKSVYILQYSPSVGDVFYNPDLQILSQWCQMKGWKIPQPHPQLIKEDKEFWKHFYDTLVIDSDYLDEIYGVRPQFEK